MLLKIKIYPKLTQYIDKTDVLRKNLKKFGKFSQNCMGKP